MLRRILFTAGMGYLMRRFMGGGRGMGYARTGGSRWGRRGW